MNRKSTMDELRRLSVEEFKEAPKFPFHIVLDDIRSLNNIGSIFRTADAFRLAHIHLCGITASPPHRDIQKTALGATESVNWTYHESVTDCVNELKNRGMEIHALEQTSSSTELRSFLVNRSKEMVLVVGNEVKGVSVEALDLCDGSIEIIQFGTKHSLNVAVSVGMAIFHISGQLMLKDRHPL